MRVTRLSAITMHELPRKGWHQQIHGTFTLENRYLLISLVGSLDPRYRLVSRLLRDCQLIGSPLNESVLFHPRGFAFTFFNFVDVSKVPVAERWRK